jgi:hypothetical protein
MAAFGKTGYIDTTHSRPRHYMEMNVQRHAQAEPYLRGKDPRYPLDRRSRSGHRGYRKNASAGDRTSIARSSIPVM